MWVQLSLFNPPTDLRPYGPLTACGWLVPEGRWWNVALV
jgi:hypothetical protein